MDKILEDIQIEELQETLYIEATYNNLMMEALTEASDENGEKSGVIGKINAWASKNISKVKGEVTKKINNIKRAVSMLNKSNREWDMFKKTRILNDIQAYSRFAQYINNSRAMKIALYDVNKAVAYANYSFKAEVSGNAIAKLDAIVKKDLRSKKLQKLQYETENYTRVAEGPEAQRMIKNFVQNLAVAAAKLNQMLFSLIRASENLSRNANAGMKKLNRIKITPGIKSGMGIPGTSVFVRDRKKDRRHQLYISCLTVIAYANKQISNMCLSALNKIEKVAMKFNDIAESKANKARTTTVDNNVNDDTNEEV